jgi:LPXTG-motif cell wall-anchored protein
MRKAMAFVGMISLSVFLLASTAFAVDYPPTIAPKSVVTVEAAQAAQAQAAAASQSTSTSGGLPFTGGNTMVLVWIAVACLAAGAFFIARSRRKHTV